MKLNAEVRRKIRGRQVRKLEEAWTTGVRGVKPVPSTGSTLEGLSRTSNGRERLAW